MGLAGDEVVYPSPEEICEINERLCRETGGFWKPPHNIRTAGQLEYLIEKSEGTVFEQAGPVSLTEKAASLAFFLITQHVFFDGNKRTGIFVAWHFLEANGLHVVLDESVEDLALRVANGVASAKDLEEWLAARIR